MNVLLKKLALLSASLTLIGISTGTYAASSSYQLKFQSKMTNGTQYRLKYSKVMQTLYGSGGCSQTNMNVSNVNASYAKPGGVLAYNIKCKGSLMEKSVITGMQVMLYKYFKNPKGWYAIATCNYKLKLLKSDGQYYLYAYGVTCNSNGTGKLSLQISTQNLAPITNNSGVIGGSTYVQFRVYYKGN